VIVVADAGPLITLSLIGQFPLLERLYERMVIPREVRDEVVVRGDGLPGCSEVKEATWIDVVESDPSDPVFQALREDLDLGESAALAVAAKGRADLVLVDDRKGRLAAKRLGLS
jgi:predicted nucleic acid-binding protein